MKRSQKTILVADDEKDNLMYLIKTLMESGENYQVISAINGSIALELALSKKPDLLVLDWNMPGLTGVEVVAKLKDIPEMADTPIIMATALSQAEDLEAAMALGAFDYLIKPINRIELLARVKNALSHHDYIRKIKAQQNELAASYKELEASRNEQKELNLVKDKFFSIISHDLKSPIGSLQTFLEMICQNMDIFSTDELKEIFEEARKNVSDVMGLIQNLLAWSAAQMGRMSANTESIPLSWAQSENAKLFEKEYAKKGVSLIVFTNGGSVAADKNMLDFILRNLLANALKFTKKGQEVTLESVVLDNGKSQITVRDTGVGIPQDKIGKLFNTGERFTTKGTSDESGTGLGLKFCYEFALKMGGTLAAESEEGKGSAFILTLPAGTNEE